MLKRILLFISGFLVLLVSAYLVIATFDIVTVPNLFVEIIGNWQYGILFIITSFLGLLAMVLSFTTKRTPTSLLLPSEHGEVRVSLLTIDSLVHQGAKQIRGIKELKSKIIVRDGKLYICVKAVLYGDRNIPELTQQLQQLISEHVYTISGISVDEVKVLVENVATDIKTKVN